MEHARAVTSQELAQEMQVDLIEKMQKHDINLQTCPDCGKPALYDLRLENPVCPHCGAEGEHCDFPDMFWQGMSWYSVPAIDLASKECVWDSAGDKMLCRTHDFEMIVTDEDWEDDDFAIECESAKKAKLLKFVQENIPL